MTKEQVQGLLMLRAGAARADAIAKVLGNERNLAKAESDLEALLKRGINAVALGEQEYPVSLAAIHNPPPILFFRGRSIAELQSSSIAVVGSRKADSAAQRAARDLSLEIARCGVTVVSGLAYGIDTVAHYAALEGGGDYPTVAVLGGCLNNIYPASNEALAREIIENGGTILSQFEPGSRAYPSNFLDRNRVIAGLCRGVVVIQAGMKSGSLATARFAMEEGREVLVTPGPAFDDRYAGSHRLIRDGATMVASIEHLVDCFPDLSREESERPVVDIDPEFLAVIEAIQDGPKHFDFLRQEIGAVLDMALMELEMSGLLARLPGNYIEITNLGRELAKKANS